MTKNFSLEGAVLYTLSADAPATSLELPAGGEDILIVNPGASTVYVRGGAEGVEETLYADGLPVLAGEKGVYGRGTSTHLAAYLPGTAATGVLTLAGNAVADETVTIDGHVYTWKATVSTTADQVKIGASASASIDNLVAAILATAASAGTLFGSATTEHETVTAAAGAGDTMDVTSKIASATGNAYGTTETMTAGSWGAATLGSGVDPTPISLMVVVGTGS